MFRRAEPATVTRATPRSGRAHAPMASAAGRCADASRSNRTRAPKATRSTRRARLPRACAAARRLFRGIPNLCDARRQGCSYRQRSRIVSISEIANALPRSAAQLGSKPIAAERRIAKLECAVFLAALSNHVAKAALDERAHRRSFARGDRLCFFENRIGNLNGCFHIWVAISINMGIFARTITSVKTITYADKP